MNPTTDKQCKKPVVKQLTNIEKAERAADLLNSTDGEEPIRTFWDALDEPRRDEMLTYFAEWDTRFCDALNPAPA